MKFVQALDDKVVVEIIKEEKKTESGLIIPSNVDKDPQGYGLILSVGEDISTLNIGDIVIFHKNAGMAIIVENKIMKVLTYKEIYGKIVEIV
jgi:chaperonin GroES